MENPDIVFLLSHIPNPRMNKRIAVAKKNYSVGVICWDKKTLHVWELCHLDVLNSVIELTANSASPFKRIKQTFIFAYKALNKLKFYKPKCIYAGNLDMLIIAKIYSCFSRCHIIYEVADINRYLVEPPNSLHSNLIQQGLKFIEKFCCRHINNLVLTSKEYYNSYYKTFITPQKVLVIPNIPDLNAFKSYHKKTSGNFTVGFIGGIRFVDQLAMMVDAAEYCTADVFIAGSSFDVKEEEKLKEYCKNKPFVKFGGRYDYDSEIASLYSKCDCIYAVYNADLINVQNAIPNKLYESIYCELPIIVARGTYLSKIVEESRVGISVNHKDKAEVINVINKLKNDPMYLEQIAQNCKKEKQNYNLECYNEALNVLFYKAVGEKRSI